MVCKCLGDFWAYLGGDSFSERIGKIRRKRNIEYVKSVILFFFFSLRTVFISKMSAPQRFEPSAILNCAILPVTAIQTRQSILLQPKRANFKEATVFSVICNIHFSPDCYQRTFLEEMGFKKTQKITSRCCVNNSVDNLVVLHRNSPILTWGALAWGSTVPLVFQRLFSFIYLSFNVNLLKTHSISFASPF